MLVMIPVAMQEMWNALLALKQRWQAETDPLKRAEIHDEYYRLHQDYIIARRKARQLEKAEGSRE